MAEAAAPAQATAEAVEAVGGSLEVAVPPPALPAAPAAGTRVAAAGVAAAQVVPPAALRAVAAAESSTATREIERAARGKDEATAVLVETMAPAIQLQNASPDRPAPAGVSVRSTLKRLRP